MDFLFAFLIYVGVFAFGALVSLMLAPVLFDNLPERRIRLDVLPDDAPKVKKPRKSRAKKPAVEAEYQQISYPDITHIPTNHVVANGQMKSE